MREVRQPSPPPSPDFQPADYADFGWFLREIHRSPTSRACGCPLAAVRVLASSSTEATCAACALCRPGCWGVVCVLGLTGGVRCSCAPRTSPPFAFAFGRILAVSRERQRTLARCASLVLSAPSSARRRAASSRAEACQLRRHPSASEKRVGRGAFFFASCNLSHLKRRISPLPFFKTLENVFAQIEEERQHFRSISPPTQK
jgi:hypothetical protein